MEQMEKKQVSYDQMSDQEKFLWNIRKAQEEIVGFERYGNEVEFFDENGAVVLTISYNEFTGEFNFNFGNMENFSYSVINPQDAEETINDLIENSAGSDFLDFSDITIEDDYEDFD